MNIKKIQLKIKELEQGVHKYNTIPGHYNKLGHNYWKYAAPEIINVLKDAIK